MKRRLFVGLAILVGTVSCSVVAPCGTDDLSMRVSPTTAALAVGQRVTATAEFRGCRGERRLADVITWSVTDSTVATVHPTSGVITGRAAGVTAVIPSGARYGTLSSIAVTVR